jgi:group I intron endonuclease
MHYLYKITNTINGKNYIGQTVNLTKRWWRHRNDAADPKYPIHYAIKKYGAHNFEFIAIATCKTDEDANYLEILLIDQCESHISKGKGYNITKGGKGVSGYKHTDEAKAKISALLIGNDYCVGRKASDETKDKMSIAHKGNKSRTGMKNTDEWFDKVVGFKHTDETKKKMSEAHHNSGNDFEPGHEPWNKGKQRTEEEKKTISEACKEAWRKRKLL